MACPGPVYRYVLFSLCSLKNLANLNKSGYFTKKGTFSQFGKYEAPATLGLSFRKPVTDLELRSAAALYSWPM